MPNNIVVHERPQTLAHPNHCHSCGYGGSDRQFYVDTGVPTEWDGQIIFCSACMLVLVIKTYGFDPFVVIEQLVVDKEAIVGEYAADRELLNQVRQGLAILGLTTTSLTRLAGFLEEEKDGNQGRIDFAVDSSDSNTSSVDSEPELPIVSGLSLS